MYYPCIYETTAAWLMSLSLLAYLLLAVTGILMFRARQRCSARPKWLRYLHWISGCSILVLVLLLLAIGIIGTLDRFGTLGHSSHLYAGLTVVGLVLLSAGSATQISAKPGARSLHIATNTTLVVAFFWVLLTGWKVMQKYLP